MSSGSASVALGRTAYAQQQLTHLVCLLFVVVLLFPLRSLCMPTPFFFLSLTSRATNLETRAVPPCSTSFGPMEVLTAGSALSLWHRELVASSSKEEEGGWQLYSLSQTPTCCARCAARLMIRLLLWAKILTTGQGCCDSPAQFAAPSPSHLVRQTYRAMGEFVLFAALLMANHSAHLVHPSRC